VRGNWLVIALALIVTAVAMLAIGYAVAAVARNTETAASYANLITFPMMFLSGVFFPLGSMPDWLQPIIRLMPLKYGVEALREPMLYGRGLGTIATDLLILLAIFAVAMLFAIRFFRWEEAEVDRPRCPVWSAHPLALRTPATSGSTASEACQISQQFAVAAFPKGP